jgi:hypothetical protein
MTVAGRDVPWIPRCAADGMTVAGRDVPWILEAPPAP